MGIDGPKPRLRFLNIYNNEIRSFRRKG